LRLAVVVALVVLVADQVAKAIVEATMSPHETIPLLPFFALSYVRNTGAAFGVLGSAPASFRAPLFIGITLVAVGALVSFVRHTPGDQRATVAALGAILGGAVGNLVCRLRYGEVVDFLDVHWRDLHWPAFNVADSAITVGVAVVLLGSFRERKDAAPERSVG
jgi:signal peptidase II